MWTTSIPWLALAVSVYMCSLVHLEVPMSNIFFWVIYTPPPPSPPIHPLFQIRHFLNTWFAANHIQYSLNHCNNYKLNGFPHQVVSVNSTRLVAVHLMESSLLADFYVIMRVLGLLVSPLIFALALSNKLNCGAFLRYYVWPGVAVTPMFWWNVTLNPQLLYLLANVFIIILSLAWFVIVKSFYIGFGTALFNIFTGKSIMLRITLLLLYMDFHCACTPLLLFLTLLYIF